MTPYTGRERAVPCREIGCRRPTWRDDAFCDFHAPTVDRAAPSPLRVDNGGDALAPHGAFPPPPRPEGEPMPETATEAAARAVAPLLGQIADDAGLLTADQLPRGCAVKIGGEWCGFEGIEDGAMVLSTHSAGFSYTPTLGERFVWASPF